LLIPPYYAASGGEYTQKRFNNLAITSALIIGLILYPVYSGKADYNGPQKLD